MHNLPSTPHTSEVLPLPAQYYPWTKGSYDINPNLKPLGTDFGNGLADRFAIQIDRDFPRYRANKLACLAEEPNKYVMSLRLSHEVATAASDCIVQLLCSDQPPFFHRSGKYLGCKITGDEIDLTEPPEQLLRNLCLQIQEDLAVVSVEEGRDWISYLNVCSPSHWVPEEKLGKPFMAVHEPVPGFAKLGPAAPGLVRAMVQKGPFVRFVWTVVGDWRLNHHPVPPAGEDPELWASRDFSSGRFWVRTERQVLLPLTQANASLFLIRVGYVADESIKASPDLHSLLLSTLEGMPSEIRAYKGLAKNWSTMIDLIDSNRS